MPFIPVDPINPPVLLEASTPEEDVYRFYHDLNTTSVTCLPDLLRRLEEHNALNAEIAANVASARNFVQEGLHLVKQIETQAPHLYIVKRAVEQQSDTIVCVWVDDEDDEDDGGAQNGEDNKDGGIVKVSEILNPDDDDGIEIEVLETVMGPFIAPGDDLALRFDILMNDEIAEMELDDDGNRIHNAEEGEDEDAGTVESVVVHLPYVVEEYHSADEDNGTDHDSHASRTESGASEMSDCDYYSDSDSDSDSESDSDDGNRNSGTDESNRVCIHDTSDAETETEYDEFGYAIEELPDPNHYRQTDYHKAIDVLALCRAVRAAAGPDAPALVDPDRVEAVMATLAAAWTDLVEFRTARLEHLIGFVTERIGWLRGW